MPGIVLGAKATAGGQDSMVPITHHKVYILAGQLRGRVRESDGVKLGRTCRGKDYLSFPDI